MGKMQRTKGNAGERELAGILSEELGFLVKRNLSQTRDGGYDLRVGKFIIECKRAKRYCSSWMRQAIRQAGELEINPERDEFRLVSVSAPGLVPVLLYRLDRHKWQAEMLLSDMLKDTSYRDATVTMSLPTWVTFCRENH
jgi:hypothetical protein